MDPGLVGFRSKHPKLKTPVTPDLTPPPPPKKKIVLGLIFRVSLGARLNVG